MVFACGKKKLEARSTCTWNTCATELVVVYVLQLGTCGVSHTVPKNMYRPVAYKSQSAAFSKSDKVSRLSSLLLSTRADRHEAGGAHYCTATVCCSGHYCHCCTFWLE